MLMLLLELYTLLPYKASEGMDQQLIVIVLRQLAGAAQDSQEASHPINLSSQEV